jgi:L-gulonate 3-dehydrogenase
MFEPTIKTVSLIGTGVIGRGWIQVFIRAGCKTRIYDPDPEQAQKALDWVRDDLKRDAAEGLISEDETRARLNQVSAYDQLAEALNGAGYIQESGPERLEVKQAIFAEMDRLAVPETILASSTSALDIADITTGLEGAGRCFTAHPFNPPHILPAVEMMPTRQASPELYQRAIQFLESVGQKPVKMNFFVPGYLANRIQAAVVREALHLVQIGAADVDAVDTVISDALGLRWALFGNFGTNNTNADGGIREYYTRFGHAYTDLMADLDSTPPSFSPEMIEKIGSQVDIKEGSASNSEICRWRDRMCLKIRTLKEDDPHP